MKNRNLLKLVTWLGTLVILAGIFYFSSQNGFESNRMSQEVTTEIFSILDERPGDSIDLADYIGLGRIDNNELIRKLAHFGEYFLLAGVLYFALSFHISFSRKKSIATFVLCILFAISDEIHQMFVPYRSPLVLDVLIDAAGVLSSVLLIRMAVRITGKKQNSSRA